VLRMQISHKTFRELLETGVRDTDETYRRILTLNSRDALKLLRTPRTTIDRTARLYIIDRLDTDQAFEYSTTLGSLEQAE